MSRTPALTRLHTLLRDGVAHRPRYPTRTFGPLTNHLPMALTALHALGGSATWLDDFRRAYSARRVPLNAGVPGLATEYAFAQLRSRAAASPPLQSVDFSARLADGEHVLKLPAPCGACGSAPTGAARADR